MKPILAIATSTLLAATTTLLAGGPVNAIPLPPPGPVLDLDAHASIDWGVPSRYQASWQAWDEPSHSYNQSFVNPGAWSVILNFCGSRSKWAISGYTFTLAQVGGPWQLTRTSSGCTVPVSHALPAQGVYTAKVTVNTTTPGGVGVSLPVSTTIVIRDQLIVSIGDSMASGEGNPDVQGDYSYTTNITGEVTGVTSTQRAAVWKDERCHRSANSGPARAAKSLEDADPKTSVTFISLACSGAEIRNLVDTPYLGNAPAGTAPLLPQIDAVRAATGAAAADPARPARTIDALLVTAGINDVHFSDIVERCATNFVDNDSSCVTSGGIAQQMQTIIPGLTGVVGAIRSKLPATREIYLNDYPSDPFHGGGCEAFGFIHTGINAGEAAAMADWGRTLNLRISQVAHALKADPYAVNHLDLSHVPFGDHAYCSSSPWLVHYYDSWRHQGDKKGTVHPNAAGAQAFANEILRQVVPNQPATPVQRLKITINAIYSPVAAQPGYTVPVVLYQYQNDNEGLPRSYALAHNGQWNPVPPADGTFLIDMYPTPSSPRHATSWMMNVANVLTLIGSSGNGYLIGHHVVMHPAGASGVDYTVAVIG